jgi:broad specificity phosphatase PhoE
VTTFVLVRHGAHDWLGRGLAGRLPGVSLNAQGWLQAESLVQRLQGRDIAAIYSSPQPRAQETVAPLAGRRKLPIRLLEPFDEVDFGDWTGREFEYLQQRDADRWRQWCFHRSQAQPPGGEPFAHVCRRAMNALHEMCNRYPDGTVLICSHGDVIKAVIASSLQMSLDHLECFDIEPASVSELHIGAGWRKVKYVNRVG